EPQQAPLSPDYVPGPKEPEQAPLSSNYVPGPEEPKQAPPSPVYLPYVPEPVYPEYMPPEDDVFLTEEQPLPVVATPTAESPGYILEFDPNGNPEENDEEDPKEDPADYPAESTVVALPAVDHVPSEEVTKPLPHIPSPPLPIPSPPTNSPTHIEISKSCLPLRKRLCFGSPTPSQEVGESSTAGATRQDEPAVARDSPYSLVREELYGFFDRVDVAPGRLMSKELGYGITDTWDELVRASEEIAPTTLQGVNQRVTDLSTVVEQETTIMYSMMEEAQDDRSQLIGRDYSDIGSPEVDGPSSPEYMPGPEEPQQAPLSPDYVPGPKEPEQAPLSSNYVPGPEEPKQAPPSPVYLPYVPEPVYPEYMPPEDDVFLTEEQPLP
nr:hypothetical protein [Tanacetum cinerariifolium]